MHEWVQLFGSTLGIGLVAGIRLYATVFILGASIRYGWIPLGPGQEHWAILAHPAVMVVAGGALLVEFTADKIPWVDSLWDSFHTLIRPVGAAVLATTIMGDADPALKVLLVILCGGVALTSHSSKAASRLAVNQSPEPFSNFFLSLLEDVLAPLGLWLAIQHPGIMLALVLIFLAVFAWLAVRVFRLMKRQMSAVLARFKKQTS